MDGLTLLRTISFVVLLLLIPFAGNAVSHSKELYTCQCSYHLNEDGSVIGNGRKFWRTEEEHKFHGKTYPVYEDLFGRKAYLEGMIILEIRTVKDYDFALAWSVKADEFTTYHDLGITLLEFYFPSEAEKAYESLANAQDPNILYMEMALIEKPIW